jgi:hypothetical protein
LRRTARTPVPARPASDAASSASAHNGVDVSVETATRPAFAPAGIGPPAAGGAALVLPGGVNSSARKLLDACAGTLALLLLTMLDAATLLDAAVLDAAVLDAAVLEAAVLDAAVLEAAVLDAAVLEAAVLDAAVDDAALLVDVDGMAQPALKIAIPAAFQFAEYVFPLNVNGGMMSPHFGSLGWPRNHTSPWCSR